MFTLTFTPGYNTDKTTYDASNNLVGISVDGGRGKLVQNTFRGENILDPGKLWLDTEIQGI